MDLPMIARGATGMTNDQISEVTATSHGGKREELEASGTIKTEEYESNREGGQGTPRSGLSATELSPNAKIALDYFNEVLECLEVMNDECVVTRQINENIEVVQMWLRNNREDALERIEFYRLWDEAPVSTKSVKPSKQAYHGLDRGAWSKPAEVQLVDPESWATSLIPGVGLPEVMHCVDVRPDGRCAIRALSHGYLGTQAAWPVLYLMYLVHIEKGYINLRNWEGVETSTRFYEYLVERVRLEYGDAVESMCNNDVFMFGVKEQLRGEKCMWMGDVEMDVFSRLLGVNILMTEVIGNVPGKGECIALNMAHKAEDTCATVTLVLEGNHFMSGLAGEVPVVQPKGREFAEIYRKGKKGKGEKPHKQEPKGGSLSGVRGGGRC
ncbi:MAG: hypothetical protein CL936_19685 [Deltaproteobacteria bacterium]|nr:hypothetical protein [Deltaproteobacteria bacterium]